MRDNFNLKDLLISMEDLDATDVHLQAGSVPAYRIKGDLEK